MFTLYGQKFAIKHNAQLQAAFADIRTKSIIVAQKHLCCGGCASSSLHTKAERMTKNGLTVLGAVYFHEQDFDYARTSGELYLGFGGHEDFDTVAVGKIVIKSLEAHNVKYTWNGTAESRILVHLNA